MHHLQKLLAAALVLAASPAFAAADLVTERMTNQAADPGAAAPQTRYESAFDGYAGMSEVELKDWREANAEVSGGSHAGHSMHSGHDMSHMGGMEGMHDGEMDHSMHGDSMSHDDQPHGHQH